MIIQAKYSGGTGKYIPEHPGSPSGFALGRPLVFRDVFPCPSLMFCFYYISPSLVYN